MLKISLIVMLLIVQTGERPENDKNGNEKSYLDSLMEFDSNNDGLIAKDELPARLHKNFDKWDMDNNGRLDAVEMQEIATAAVQDRDNHSVSSDRGRPGRQTRFGGPGLSRGSSGQHGHFGRPPGPPSASEFVEQAMKFDSDGNGELNEQELLSAAEDFLRNMPPPPGQRSGRGPAGFDFQRSNKSSRSGGRRLARPQSDN